MIWNIFWSWMWMDPDHRAPCCCSALVKGTGGIRTSGLLVYIYHESPNNKQCGRPPQHAPAPVTLTFDLLTLKVVSESHVTWATSVPILVFLGLSVLDLGPMYATDRQTSDVRQHHRLMPPPRGRGHNNVIWHARGPCTHTWYNYRPSRWLRRRWQRW